jgi:hypothetical protein
LTVSQTTFKLYFVKSQYMQLRLNRNRTRRSLGFKSFRGISCPVKPLEKIRVSPKARIYWFYLDLIVNCISCQNVIPGPSVSHDCDACVSIPSLPIQHRPRETINASIVPTPPQQKMIRRHGDKWHTCCWSCPTVAGIENGVVCLLCILSSGLSSVNLHPDVSNSPGNRYPSVDVVVCSLACFRAQVVNTDIILSRDWYW